MDFLVFQEYALDTRKIRGLRRKTNCLDLSVGIWKIYTGDVYVGDLYIGDLYIRDLYVHPLATPWGPPGIP